MTTRPELRDTGGLTPALAAVGLFAVMALVFLGSAIGPAAGFPANAEVANESLGDASLEDNASIVANNGSTVAVVEAEGGTQNTTLADSENVNATIKASGGELYGVVSEPVSITETIGYGMFGMTDRQPADLGSENFLAVFEMIDLVLVAALIGAVMLARREGEGVVVTLFASVEDEPSDAVAADGGREDEDGGDA